MGNVEVCEATGTFYECNADLTIATVFNYDQTLASRYVPSSSLFDFCSLALSFNLYKCTSYLFFLCLFNRTIASSSSPLLPSLYSIQLASRPEDPPSCRFMSSIPTPPDANGNPLIALAVAVIYAILYVLQGVKYGVSLLTIGIPR